METELKKWIDNINHLDLPKWNDLPSIGLYSEQVLAYINSYLEKIFLDYNNQKDYLVTPSMINNYVKNKIMPSPINKKYYQGHIAYILTITVLKQVGNLVDVHKGIVYLKRVLGHQIAYNTFIDFLENSLEASVLELTGRPNSSYYTKAVSLDLLPLKTATIAFTSVMLSRYLFSRNKL